MGTDWQSGSQKGTDWQRNADGHTDWQRNANQGTDWQPRQKSPAQSKARIDARRRNKYLNIGVIVDRANRKQRGKGRAKVAATRDKIEKSVGIARPTDTTGGGVASPLTEQYYDGAEGYYNLTSSDGLFVFEYGTQTEYTDGQGELVTVVHRDPDEPPPTP